MHSDRQPPSNGRSSSALTWLFMGIGGIVIAAIDESFAGFLVGVVLGWLCSQTLSQRKQLQRLQQQLGALREPAAVPSDDADQLDEAPVVVADRAPAEPAPAVEPPMAQADTLRETTPPASPPARSRELKREPDWADRLIAAGIAWLKRGNPLARIGIVILFFGGAFLAKYAAEHSLFPIELRFMALAAGALALLVLGWRVRVKRAVYAEVLQGGGIAGLYLTVFAAASRFQLLPLTLAFALMVLIALAAAVLAVAQNALSLAVIGTAGGFLAPILVSTGSGNHIALFTYYAILNVGIFAVAWFRTWRVLNVLGFVFTFTITGLWRASGYGPEDLVSADAFLILFFLMYVAVSILNCVRQPPNLKGYVSGSLVFGLPVVAFTLHATLVSRIEYALAWSALAAGAFYLALGWTLLRSGRESFRLLVEAFAALGVIFASLAIPLAFDTRTTAAMWAVEGAGLLWLGIRQRRKLARAFGALLQVAGGVGYLIGLNHVHSGTPLLNTAYLGATMLALSALFSGYWLHRNREHQASYEAGASLVFALWATAWWLFGGTSEIVRHADSWALGGTLIYVAATCVALTLAATRLAWPHLRLIGLYLPAPVALCCAVASIELGHPFAQAGGLGWLALIAVYYWMLSRNEREAERGPVPELALHVSAAWLLVLLCAWEATWQVDRYAAGVWPALPWGIVPTIAIVLLGRRVLVPGWPIAQHEFTYRVVVAAPLIVVLALWTLLTNATSTGDPVWLPYVPLINPLDVSVGLVFAAATLWWMSLTTTQRSRLWPIDPRVLIAVVAMLAFFWLNAALIRALHHNFGAPITAYGIVHSQFVQAALSIFWAVLGFTAMTLAARKHWRYVWIVGGALMLVVVAKLFLLDLSNVGTIARIVSFLTIGALLLVTGYLAPLPPKRDRDAQDDERTDVAKGPVQP